MASTSTALPSAVTTDVVGDAVDGIGDEIDVGVLQCGVVLLAEQDPLAAERIAGRQRIAQPVVGDVLAQKPLGQFLDDGQPRVVGGQRGVVVLQLPQPPPFAPRRPRTPTVSGQLLGAVRPVLLGHHPRRRALENRQLRLRCRRVRVRPARRWPLCRPPPPACRSSRRSHPIARCASACRRSRRARRCRDTARRRTVRRR